MTFTQDTVDISVNDGPTTYTVVPWDCNGAKNFLSPTGVVARDITQVSVVGETRVSKPTEQTVI